MTWGSKIQTTLLATTTLVSASIIAAGIAHADGFIVDSAETTANGGNTIDGGDSLTIASTGSITVTGGTGVEETRDTNSVTLKSGASVSADDDGINLSGNTATQASLAFERMAA